jgi:diaminohydroxyphosphoribosylaminopyrimidine deaminase/5-amino-6-(5-phosphoribosylamino)uracil reductase
MLKSVFANPMSFRYNNCFGFNAVRNDLSEAMDTMFMDQALALAARGIGTTFPNPRVGAVVVKNGVVVGSGFHRAAGEPHAEALALAAAGEAARGASVYVTLEPCSHHGRTGPCADALIAAGVKEVVAAMADPNPKVAGMGFQKLEKAGIAVRKDVRRDEAADLNEAFLFAIQHGRPWIHLKWAMTLDGKNAPPAGGTHSISGPQSRSFVHRLRAEADAVMVGGETVRVDDPQLNVRDFQWPDGRELRQPTRVVVTNKPVDVTRAVFRDGAPRLVLFGAEPGADALASLERARVESEVFAGPHGIDWERALEALGKREIRSLLVEAGPRLAGELIRSRLVERVTVLIAPKVLGGAGSRSAVGGPDPRSLADALALVDVKVSMVGDDICISGRVQKSK